MILWLGENPLLLVLAGMIYLVDDWLKDIPWENS